MLSNMTYFKKQIKLIIFQVVDCYVKLQSWPEAVKWSEFLDNIKLNQNGLSFQGSNSSNNLSYLRYVLNECS